jgi:5-methylcytosine-specific restriction endonuclease McrA
MDTLLLNADGNPVSVLPMSTVSWQVAIRLLMLEKAVPIKYYDNWVVRSPSLTLQVPSIIMTKKYVKCPKHAQFTRYNLFLRDEFTCQLQITSVCSRRQGKGHDHKELTLDHVNPKSYGGDQSWTNIITACAECNSHKGNKVVVPKKVAKVPTYFELADKRRKSPIFISDMSWADYLGWEKDLVFLKGKKTNI